MSSTLARSPVASTRPELGEARPSPPPTTMTQSPQGPSPRTVPRASSRDEVTSSADGVDLVVAADAKDHLNTDDRTNVAPGASKALFPHDVSGPLIEPNDRTPLKTSVSPDSAPRRSPVLSSPRTGGPSPQRQPFSHNNNTMSSPPNSGRGALFLPTATATGSGSARSGGDVVSLVKLTPQPPPPSPHNRSHSGSVGHVSGEVSASVMGSRRLVVHQLNQNNTNGLTSLAATALEAAPMTVTTTTTTTTGAPRNPSMASQGDVTVVPPASSSSSGLAGPMPPLLSQRRSSLGNSIASSSASSATSSARPSFRRNVLTLQRYASGNNMSDALGASVASSISTTLTSLSPCLQPIVDNNGASLSSTAGRAGAGQVFSIGAAGSDGAASVMTLSGEGSPMHRQTSGSSFSGTRRIFRRTTTPQQQQQQQPPRPSSTAAHLVDGQSGRSKSSPVLGGPSSSSSSAHVRSHSGSSNPEMHSFLRHQYMLLQQDATTHLENTTASARRTSEQMANGTRSLTDHASTSSPHSRSPQGQEAPGRGRLGGNGSAGAGAIDASTDAQTFKHVLRRDCPRHSAAARVALEKKLEEERLLSLQRQRHYEKIIVNGGHEQVDPSLKKSASLASALSRQQKKRQSLHQPRGSSLTRSSSSLFNSMVITSVQGSEEDDDDESPALAATTGGMHHTDHRALTESPVIYGSMYGQGQNGSDNDDNDNEFAPFTSGSAVARDAAGTDGDITAEMRSDAEHAAAWQRSSASSMYGHGGSGTGRPTTTTTTTASLSPAHAQAHTQSQTVARPRSASSGEVRPAASTGRPRRFSLDTMSLAVPLKSASTAASLPRAQSVGGGVASGFLVRKVTEFTVPLAKDSSSDEESDLYGPPSRTARTSSRLTNNMREGGELKSYTVHARKNAGESATRRGGACPPARGGSGYGYGYGLDDDDDEANNNNNNNNLNSSSDEDNCFSFYSPRARIKPVRGAGSAADKKGEEEDDDDDDDELTGTGRSVLSAANTTITTLHAGTAATSVTGGGGGGGGGVSPQSRRSTIPFSDDTRSLSATLSGRLSRQSVQPPDSPAGLAHGAHTVVKAGERDLPKRPASAGSGVVDWGTEEDKDSDPQACCHCCPCRRPENFHLLLRPRSTSNSLSGELAPRRTSARSTDATMTTTTQLNSAPSTPAHHHQLFTPIDVRDTDAGGAAAADAAVAMGEVSVEALEPLTGPPSTDVSMTVASSGLAASPSGTSDRLMSHLRDAQPRAALGHGAGLGERIEHSANSSAIGGASPPPYTAHTAAATPSMEQRTPAQASTKLGSSLPTPLRAEHVIATVVPNSSDDEDDEDAPVLSIQSFRRSSSRNIKRLGSADASPI